MSALGGNRIYSSRPGDFRASDSQDNTKTLGADGTFQFPPADEDVAREVQHYALGRLPSPEAAPALAYAGVDATPDERKSWGIIEID